MSNPPHFTSTVPQFPSHRWCIQFKREENLRRGQFCSEVNIWFISVSFRLPLVEKYISEYNFLRDFPNGATDVKHEVTIKRGHFKNNHYRTVISKQKVKENQRKEKRKSMTHYNSIVYLSLFYRYYYLWFSIHTFPCLHDQDLRKSGDFRTIKRNHFFKKQTPCTEGSKAVALLHHTKTCFLTYMYCVYTVICIKTEMRNVRTGPRSTARWSSVKGKLDLINIKSKI